MRFTIATVLAVLPIFAAALPQPAYPRADIKKIPITKRSNLVKRDGTVDADQLRKHINFVEAKLQRGSATFGKNTGRGMNPHRHTSQIHKTQSPTSKTDAMTKGPTTTSTVHILTPNILATSSAHVATSSAIGSEPITDDDSGLMWQGAISVGTPPVEYTVQFDTGSSDLFLPGPDCKENCEGHKIYDPSTSSTSSDVGKPFFLEYADGSTASGEQYLDTVVIANFTATKQTLGVASEYSASFSISENPPDGLMGMAFQTISEFNAPPVVQMLLNDGAITDPVFAFKLATSGSELSIGGANQDLFTGEFTYTPVTQEGFWQVDMDSVSVGGSKALGTTSSIVDTGTTLIFGDSSSVAQVYKAIPGSKDASSTFGEGVFTFPCNSVPTVSLSFGGKPFDISSELFNLGSVTEGGSDCVGGIVGGDPGGSGWTIGDVFLQNVYTIFDLGNTQVGFAALA